MWSGTQNCIRGLEQVRIALFNDHFSFNSYEWATSEQAGGAMRAMANHRRLEDAPAPGLRNGNSDDQEMEFATRGSGRDDVVEVLVTVSEEFSVPRVMFIGGSPNDVDE